MPRTREDRLAYVRKKVEDILCELCHVAQDKIHGKTSPVNDLGLDGDPNCEALEFVHNLEDEFDLSLSFDDAQVEAFAGKTVDEIVTYLEEQLPTNADFLTAGEETAATARSRRTKKLQEPSQGPPLTVGYAISAQSLDDPCEILDSSSHNDGGDDGAGEGPSEHQQHLPA